MTTAQSLPEVILGLPRKDDDRLAAIIATVTAVDGNPNFPTSGPFVAAVKAAIPAYANAIADAKKGVPGAPKVRKDARTAVGKPLEGLRLNIQSVIDEHIESAATLAESAKMKLRKVARIYKEAFAAKDGPLAGSVVLAAKAILRALLYFWEFSLDQKVWTVANDTSRSFTLVSGLTVGQTYYFRFRTRSRTGMSDYSQTVWLVVR